MKLLVEAVSLSVYYRCFLLWIAVSSVLDQALTTYGVSLDILDERNPTMDWFLSRSPLAAFIIRLVVVAVGLGILVWAYKRKPLAAWSGVVLVSVALAWVTVLHALWVNRFVFPLL